MKGTCSGEGGTKHRDRWGEMDREIDGEIELHNKTNNIYISLIRHLTRLSKPAANVES